MALPFDITPTTSEASESFTLAAGEKATLTLYRADGKGLLPGDYALIQREVDTGIWQTYGTLNNGEDSTNWDAEGTWRLFKPASTNAYGAKGN